MNTLKLFYKNPLEKFDTGELSKFGNWHILPTKEAIRSAIDERVFENGGFIFEYFLGFDELVRSGTKSKRADRLLRRLALKKVIKEMNRPDYSNSYVKIYEKFFDELIMNRIDVKKLSENLNSGEYLCDIYKNYLKFFTDKNIDLDRSYSEFQKYNCKKRNVVIDGFFKFTESEIGIIDNLKNFGDVTIHMPYAIEGFRDEALLKRFKDMGFEIISDDEISISELLKEIDLKIYSGKNVLDELFGRLKERDLLNLKAKIITGSIENNALLARAEFEGLDFFTERSEESLFIDEFKFFIRYLTNKDREEIIRRSTLNYFKIKNPQIVERALLSLKFSDIFELKNILKREVSLELFELQEVQEFVELMEKESLNSINKDNFTFLKVKLDEVIENNSISEEDGEYLLAQELREIFVMLENYIEYLGEEDLSSLIIEEISNKKFTSEKNFEGIRLIAQASNLYSKSDFSIYIGYEEDFYKKSENFLTPLYRSEEDEEREALLNLLINLVNTGENIFILDANLSGKNRLIMRLLNEGACEFESCFYPVTSFVNEDLSLSEYKKDFSLDQECLLSLKKILKNSFRATDFDAMARCKRNYLLNRVFKLEEFKLEPGEDMRNLGIMYHDVLMRYYKRYPHEFNREGLQEILSVGRDCSDPLNKLDFLIQLDLLSEFIEEELSLREDDAQPKYFELDKNIRYRDLVIFFRIDRVDEIDGANIIIDYKLSRSATHSDIINNKSFQLPIYARAFRDENKKLAALRYEIIKSKSIKDVLRNLDYLEKNKQRCNVSGDEFDKIIDASLEGMYKLYCELLEGDFNERDEGYFDSFYDLWSN